MSTHEDSSPERDSDDAGHVVDHVEELEIEVETGSPLIEEIEAPVTPTQDEAQATDAPVVHARAYQLEMFEESLKQNIIVAMDTGSGKTQVAVLRIQAELKRSPPGKIVWFLAPTVALCDQQFKVLKSQIPAVQIKFVSGNDKVDTWSEKGVWDDFLKNVGVVVSTYEILRDAISHAFVEMHTLSLLVFDEAHNCVKNHPGSRIMARYHEIKGAGLPVPMILGLTASPVIRSKLEDLEIIEQTLDAVCKTPSIHKAELLTFSKRPSMECIRYILTDRESNPSIFTPSMISLDQALHGLDINKDPYIVHLRAEKTERSRTRLREALKKHDTYIFSQMRSFCRKSIVIRCELGVWAADYFISTAISQYITLATTNDPWLAAWNAAEKRYLANILRKVKTRSPTVSRDMPISTKVDALITALLSPQDNSFGIVFVKEIATVAVLSHILSVHPLTRDRFSVGSMCGLSSHSKKKKNVGELKRDDDEASLASFRSGDINLLIGTNVLEEGIDVPACNLVICFDRPSNLKSFIQRRGRARMQTSRFLILLDHESTFHHLQWEELEQEMKRKYEDEMREIVELEKLDESAGSSLRPFRIQRTGAKLDPEQAKPHLEHFCAVLGARKYVDSRPYYVIEEVHHFENAPPQIRATVVLPVSLPLELRRVQSANAWFSEKNAFKDAAFQAYIKLYHAGLVNDNLMPLRDDDLFAGVGPRVSMLKVNQQWSPWPQMARTWTEAPGRLYRRSVKIFSQNRDIISEFDALLPVPIPDVPGFNVYWDRESPWEIEFGTMTGTSVSGRDQTRDLITLAYGHRNLVPREDSCHVVQFHSPIGVEVVDQREDRVIVKELVTGREGKFPYLVRDVHGYPHFYEGWLSSMPSLDLVQKKLDESLEDHPTDVPWVVLEKWRRSRDFLHLLPSDSIKAKPSDKPYKEIWPASLCRYDAIEIRHVQFGSLVPCITHIIEIYLVANELRTTILKDVDIQRLDLIVTAISSPVARETSNYQRFEFLGDALLKLLATLNVAVNYPSYPEGYLSQKKDLIVSNARLYRSAIETGLDSFILSTPFAGRWGLEYMDNYYAFSTKERKSEKREMSTKVLADVVESLIGASFLDGGMPKALRCLRLFVPEVRWHDPEAGRQRLASRRPSSDQLPAMFAPVESMIGYRFKNKTLLVEALTHASYNVGTSTDSCQERLEFLGDAVLDNVIVSMLWEKDLSHQDMHLLRTASVNADLLGFTTMEWATTQEATSISSPKHIAPGEVPTVTECEIRLPFWKFMQFSSGSISTEQQAAEKRHAEERADIIAALQHGRSYPWTLLAHLNIPKFFSDLFESVLGAVWVDSGSMEICQRMVERAGIMSHLRRMLNDKVDARHPKNKLGELADRKKVRYAVTTEGGLGCKVFVDDVFVVEVGNGINKDEVITKAAEAAYEILRVG